QRPPRIGISRAHQDVRGNCPRHARGIDPLGSRRDARRTRRGSGRTPRRGTQRGCSAPRSVGTGGRRGACQGRGGRPCARDWSAQQAVVRGRDCRQICALVLTRMGDMSRILSAVAWPYANGPRHIGHVAGFGVPSDVFSRYMRMAGHDVLMVSGTDEHGTPILVQAEREGLPPQALADRYNRVIVEDLTALGLSYDLFTRTTTGNHYNVAQDLFKAVHGNGYMIAQTGRGAISPSTGRTLPDRYIEGTCPICDYDGARGDQCDNCGNQLDATDLKNPRSRINGEVPKFVETEHFYLDLPAFEESLSEWLGARHGWRPNVLNFSLNLLKDMRPRAMTRDIDWGIPVPLLGWEDNPNKRLYVWFDAVIGYLSASIEWARRQGEPEAWREWWNNPEALSYYFMGKDNITFHSQIW